MNHQAKMMSPAGINHSGLPEANNAKSDPTIPMTWRMCSPPWSSGSMPGLYARPWGWSTAVRTLPRPSQGAPWTS
jgi:hypothetical protein